MKVILINTDPDIHVQDSSLTVCAAQQSPRNLSLSSGHLKCHYHWCFSMQHHSIPLKSLSDFNQTVSSAKSVNLLQNAPSLWMSLVESQSFHRDEFLVDFRFQQWHAGASCCKPLSHTHKPSAAVDTRPPSAVDLIGNLRVHEQACVVKKHPFSL